MNFTACLLLSITILFSLFATIVAKTGLKCNQTRDVQADECMFKMFLFGDRTQTFRDELAPMQTYCRKEIVGLHKCLNQYSRQCLDQMPRQVTEILLFGVKRANSKYCSTKKGIQRFVEVAKCANHELEKKHVCMDRLMASLNFIQSLKNPTFTKNRVQFLCCYFSQFQDCIRANFPKIGDEKEKCSSDIIRSEAINLVGVYAEDVLGMVCGDYGDHNTAKCGGLFENVLDVQKLNKQKGLKNSSTISSKSFLPYLIDSFSQN